MPTKPIEATYDRFPSGTFVVKCGTYRETMASRKAAIARVADLNRIIDAVGVNELLAACEAAAGCFEDIADGMVNRPGHVAYLSKPEAAALSERMSADLSAAIARTKGVTL